MKYILMIDEHKDFREATKRYIRTRGINAEIIEAATAIQGIKAAIEHQPEIVIIDFHLGQGFNGLSVAAKIKDKLPACKVIMLTLCAMSEIKGFCKTKDVQEIINKNDLGAQLIPAINRLL